jgi:ankyrin repeat protein
MKDPFHDPSMDQSLLQAAGNGNLTLAEWGMIGGANPNARDVLGRTPLHLAAAKGHLDVFNYLLKNGADITATARDGLTPLDLAEQNRQQKIIDGYIAAHGPPPLSLMKPLKLKGLKP